jgi:tRNA (guanine37-N1)-methyltransferase
MKIDVLTLFPNMFDGFLNESIVKRAINKEKVQIDVHNIRDYSNDKHKKVDDTPYGGGAGMVLMCQPIFDAVKDLSKNNSKIILMTPQGSAYNQKIATSLSSEEHLIFICGHYEGFDERIRSLADMELSIGDYVLTGGELPSMVVIDSVVRLLDGVIDEKSRTEDSFNDGLLDYPTYTKPPVYDGMEVPDVLLSGHHENIEKWRQTEKIIRTLERRPDLIRKRQNYILAKDNPSKEIIYFEYDKMKGLDITPKNDARRTDVISITKMILIKPSFIEKIAKMKIDHKLKIFMDKFTYILNNDDDDSTDVLTDELSRYYQTIINNYIKYLGEEYRNAVLNKLQIMINELRLKKQYIFEANENEKTGKAR